MSEEDDSDKTEDPSQKKLDEARRRGQVPQSKEISHWFLILAAGIIVMMMSPAMGREMYQNLIGFWEKPDQLTLDINNIGDVMRHALYTGLFVLLIPFALLMVAAFLSSILQNGLLFAPDNIEPKLERISILKGFSRIFSMRSVVELIKGIAKIAVVGAVIFSVLWPIFDESPQFINYDMGGLLHKLQSLTAKVLMVTVAIVTAIAAVDWLYQRFSFMNQMRMSKQELKDEYRQSEGDPHVKQHQRQIRAEKARKRMMAAVPKSTVVVTNPTHYAVALLYDQDKMEAPRVVAKGVDALALRIRKVAEENKVPIMENPPLARSLYAEVELDQEIPIDYYKAVAEVISFVLKLKKRK